MEIILLENQTPKSHSKDSGNSSKRALIVEWLVRYALNADKPLTAKEQSLYASSWEQGFADVDAVRLKAAFIACYRTHAFKTIPTVGDIRQHLQKAETGAAETEAARKWDQVKVYAERLSPDFPDRNPPRILPRTRAAINAAGGLSFIRDCDAEALTWARKRFIESYIRWSELERDQFLLPDGMIKKLFAEVAASKSAPRLPEAVRQDEPARGTP
jgi:hypothetical protein